VDAPPRESDQRRPGAVAWIAAACLVAAVCVAVLWWLSAQVTARMGMDWKTRENCYAIVSGVERSGALPDTAVIAVENLSREPAVNIYGVDDESTQDALLAAVREPVRGEGMSFIWVTFFRTHVVKEDHGGARFTGGVVRIRSERVEVQ
jgi:hypothetical protein